MSADNPFAPAVFHSQFSWRNGLNGITFGSVAALQLVDAVVADNVVRGVEATAADGLATWGKLMRQIGRGAEVERAGSP